MNEESHHSSRGWGSREGSGVFLLLGNVFSLQVWNFQENCCQVLFVRTWNLHLPEILNKAKNFRTTDLQYLSEEGHSDDLMTCSVLVRLSADASISLYFVLSVPKTVSGITMGQTAIWYWTLTYEYCYILYTLLYFWYNMWLNFSVLLYSSVSALQLC